MKALGSPSISRAPMGGDHAFRILKTSVCMTDTTTIYYCSLTCVDVFLRLSREKSVKSVCYLKIYIKVYLMHKTNHA